MATETDATTADADNARAARGPRPHRPGKVERASAVVPADPVAAELAYQAALADKERHKREQAERAKADRHTRAKARREAKRVP